LVIHENCCFIFMQQQQQPKSFSPNQVEVD
jgi:hypothetical protein